MSYRIWAESKNVRAYQVYGNNEFPTKIREYLKEQGCKFDSDDCFHDFPIKDINGFLEAMFEAHKEYMKDGYWDFTPKYEIENVRELISHCWQKQNMTYAFIVYNFVTCFEEDLCEVWDTELGDIKYEYKGDSIITLSGH